MMYKALIIEDEKPAAEHLLRLIAEIKREVNVVGVISSVDEALRWFENNKAPDLIFLDVQLSDGLSFDLFDHIEITCPVIFTTAYEEYAIKAFKVNSIDYLLKPIGPEDLKFAINKFISYDDRHEGFAEPAIKFRIDQVMQLLTHKYKSRFVVKAGLHIRSIAAENINLFFSMEKSTYLTDNNGKTYDVDYPLEQIEKIVDPSLFFRISRKHIVNINAISDIIYYSGNRLKLKIKGNDDDDILVTRNNLSGFRKWLER